MARRKKTSSRRKTYFRAKKRRSKSGNGGLLVTLLSAGAYGAVRQKISNYLLPYTNKIPFGSISDEIGMLGVCYFGKKFLGRKVPMLSKVCNAGMMIESARIGEAVIQGGIFGSASTGSSSGMSFR